ncbi:TadE/TadG family type IV pilus assembly protein [Actinoplanes sp. NPDC049596]|uniref:TadE/TadG family type IV pilus assembly protein n=1 Tax=unclassified Actinoplanes TaxID=2626549 RepID=UPI003422F87D
MEFAIVLPLLLLILFGIIDMGRFLQQYILLTEAAREGARLGALNGTVTEVKAKVQGIAGAGVTLTYPTAPTVCGTGALDSSVTVTRVFSPVTPLFKLMVQFGGSSQNPGTPTIKAIGVMSCLG